MRRSLATFTVLFGLLLTGTMMPEPASAVTLTVNVGTSLNSGRGITCSQGERMLRARGFRDVRRIDCRGRYFVYRGLRGGNRFEIAVRSRDGRVVDVRRLRR